MGESSTDQSEKTREVIRASEQANRNHKTTITKIARTPVKAGLFSSRSQLLIKPLFKDLVPYRRMFFHHLQTVLKDSCVEIVEDNAKSHPSKKPATRRRGSAPTYVITSPQSRRRSFKRLNSHPSRPASRWESEAIVHSVYPSTSISSQHSLLDGGKTQTVLNKPVRRQSIEDTDLLAHIQASLSSLNGELDENENTASLLASALASIDSYEEEISMLSLNLGHAY